MEWAAVVGVIAGIVSGVGSGLFAAWFGPGAEARAEQTRLRFAARREIVDLGRHLVADLQGNLDHTAMTRDPRFLRIQHYLDPEVLNFYSPEERQRRYEQRRETLGTPEGIRLQEQHTEEAGRHPFDDRGPEPAGTRLETCMTPWVGPRHAQTRVIHGEGSLVASE